MIKRIRDGWVLVMILTLILMVVGCEPPQQVGEQTGPPRTEGPVLEEPEPSESQKEVFDVVDINMNMATESKAYNSMKFKENAPKYGLNLTTLDSKGDPSVEAQNINTAISQGADAIIICPNDSYAVVPGLMAAKEAGMVVGIFSADIPEESSQYRDYCCGADDYEAGLMAGEAFVNQFPNGASVVEIGGQSGHDAQIKRSEGFRKALEGSNIEIIDSQNCKTWATNEAMDIMQDFIVKHGDKIQGVFCHWDNGHTGIIQALVNSNIDPSTLFSVAIDGCKAGYDQVADGTQSISLMQDFDEMVSKSLELCRRVLDGEKVDEINLIPWVIISQDTIGSIERPSW